MFLYDLYDSKTDPLRAIHDPEGNLHISIINWIPDIKTLDASIHLDGEVLLRHTMRSSSPKDHTIHPHDPNMTMGFAIQVPHGRHVIKINSELGGAEMIHDCDVQDYYHLQVHYKHVSATEQEAAFTFEVFTNPDEVLGYM